MPEDINALEARKRAALAAGIRSDIQRRIEDPRKLPHSYRVGGIGFRERFDPQSRNAIFTVLLSNGLLKEEMTYVFGQDGSMKKEGWVINGWQGLEYQIYFKQDKTGLQADERVLLGDALDIETADLEILAQIVGRPSQHGRKAMSLSRLPRE